MKSNSELFLTLLSKRVYNQVIKTSAEVPVLSVENVVLVTAFGRRSAKININQLYDQATAACLRS
jgi:hypothetical protein